MNVHANSGAAASFTAALLLFAAPISAYADASIRWNPRSFDADETAYVTYTFKSSTQLTDVYVRLNFSTQNAGETRVGISDFLERRVSFDPEVEKEIVFPLTPAVRKAAYQSQLRADVGIVTGYSNSDAGVEDPPPIAGSVVTAAIDKVCTHPGRDHPEIILSCRWNPPNRHLDEIR